MEHHEGPTRGARPRSDAGQARRTPRRTPARADAMETVPLWVLPTIVLALAALSGSVLVFVLTVLAVGAPVLAAQDFDGPPRPGASPPWP